MATGSDDEGTLVVNCLDLHEMFRIVGDQMTEIDIKILKYLYNGIMPNGVIDRVKDGYDFLLGLEMMNRVDETNFKYVLDLLRMITRHDLLQYVSLRRRRAVQADPVSEYLEQAAAADSSSASSSKRNGHLTNQSKRSHTSCGTSDDVPVKCRRKSLQRAAKTKSGLANTIDTSTGDVEARPSCSTAQGRGHGEPAPRVPTNGESSNPNSFMFSSRDSMNQDKKVTCDIRLRVRAEYCHHTNALEGNVFSNKPHLIERQFEKFMQANTILKSRDLGSIICDIKFTELTYLDAFWRDYINGSLLEALKGVFITDSLKQAVGNEAIKLLVSVDEDDYEAGRVKLLKNLQI